MTTPGSITSYITFKLGDALFAIDVARVLLLDLARGGATDEAMRAAQPETVLEAAGS